jgi:hypothetical protein
MAAKIVDEALNAEDTQAMPPAAAAPAPAEGEMMAEPAAEPEGAEMPEGEESGNGVIAEAIESAAEERDPRSQKIYDRVLLGAYKVMYSKQGFPILLKKLAGGTNDIAYNYGHTLAMIMQSIQNAARRDGSTTIPPDIMFEAGLEVLEDLMKIGASSGMIKQEFAEQAQARALFVAFRVYGDAEIKGGNITQADMQAATEELRQLGLDPEAVAEATGANQQRSVDAHAKQMSEGRKQGSGAPAGQQQAPAVAAPQPPSAPTGGIVNQAAGV